MTNSQHMDALKRANEVRYYRAEVKRDIAEGKVHLDEILDAELDPRLESMEVRYLLMAQRGWGRTRAHRALSHLLQANVALRLGNMTQRQRTALSLHLGALRTTTPWSRAA